MYNPEHVITNAQRQIIRLGTHFGYVVDSEGNCEGVAYSGMAALVTGELPAFESALAAILQVKVPDLRHSTLLAYQQTKTRRIGERNKQVQLAMSMIERIAVAQNPDSYLDMLIEGSREPLMQQAVNKYTTDRVLISKKIKFYGSYDRESFKKAIKDLEECVKTLTVPFGFVLIATGHAIGLGRHQNEWVVIDANTLPIKHSTDLTEVVDFVFKAFTFETDEKTDGFCIKFQLLVRSIDQTLVERILLSWRNAQHERRLQDYKKLSKSEANNLFSKGVRDLDLTMVKEIANDPRLEVGKIPSDLECTLLYWVIEEHDLTMIQFLLSFEKIDVNLGDNESSPLYLAASRGYKDIVKLLLAHPNIDTKIENNGSTAMDIAKEKKFHEIVNLIRSHDSERADNVRIKKLKK